MAQLFPFSGVVQHYAWGGRHFLPQLLQRPNPDDRPWAELWMGAHPKGPGVLAGDRAETLEQLIDRRPADLLGQRVAARFSDRLPFLLKVLDVRDMLSIQVHPTKAAAEAGFAAEERKGPARDAPDRNYRDDNHKPELGVAVTDFYLLHGFAAPGQISESLRTVPGWSELQPIFADGGVTGLYEHIMRADQPTLNRLLQPLSTEVAGKSYSREDPRFWARRAFEQYTTDSGDYDRGIFSIFWFNLVRLSPGEGIFQDAGIPHAYLEGVCIELMANSDNVLRGGLTPKHIDVDELLDKTRFAAVEPRKLTPTEHAGGWDTYATPAPDFHLRFARPAAGRELTVDTRQGAAVILLMKGSASLANTALSEESRTVFVPAGQQLSLTTTAPCEIYLASAGK